MIKLSRTSRILLIVVLIDCVAVGSYIFLFRAVAASNERIAGIKSEVVLKEKERDNIEALRRVFNDTADLREMVSSFFVKRDGVVEFIGYLESLARSRNLLVLTKSVAIAGGGENAVHEMLRLTVEVEGSWPETVRFLSLVETMPFGVALEEISLSQSEERKGRRAARWFGRVSFSVLKIK